MAENNENRIEIEIVLDDGSLVKGFIKAERAAEKSGRKIGSSLSGSVFKGLGRALGSLQTQILAAGAAFAGAFATREIIQAASRQEDAINQLNTSLQTAGTFSKIASLEFQQWASSLQQSTTVGDETVLTLAALARNFTKTNDEAKKLTEAAIDLSAATGGKISVESAVTNLGKSLSGLTGELGETVGEVRTLTAEQLKAGEAIRVVGERFAGAEAARLRTFSGAVGQLSNNFTGFLEKIGKTITQSPIVIKAINLLSKGFKQITDAFDSLVGKDPIGNLILRILELTRTINSYLTPAISQLVGGAKFFIEAFSRGFRFIAELTQITAEAVINNFLNPILEKASALARGAGFEKLAIGLDTAIKSGIDFQNVINQITDKIGNIDEIVKDPEFLNFLKFDPATTEQKIDDFILQIINKLTESSEVVKNNGFNLGKKAEEGVKEGVSDIGNVITQITQNVNTAINGLIASSLSALGASLVQGKSAFGSFAKTAANILGDFFINLGLTIIAADQAIIALKASLISFFGGAGIAAGIGLVIAGGALKAFAGGPASAPSAPNNAIPGVAGEVGADFDIPANAGTDITDLQPLEGRDIGSSVIVNIQGDVLDSDDTGLRIAKILRDQGFKNGLTVGV